MRSVRRGQADGIAGDSQVAADEGEVAGFDGDVGAGAHGDPEVGLGEGGGVVDAVADHGDDVAVGLEAPDDLDLVAGEDLGDDGVDADVVGDVSGGSFVVAGEQDGGEAQSSELADRCGAGGLDGVGDDDRRADGTVPADEHGGVAEVLGGRLGGCEFGGEGHGPVGEEPFAAGDHAVPVDDALDAEAFEVGEAVDGGECADLLAGAGGDGLGDGVLGSVLEGAGEAEDLVGVDAVDGDRRRRVPCGRW